MLASTFLGWQALYAVLEQLINPLIRLDPASKQRLARLNQRLIALQTSSPELKIFVHCHQEGISLHSQWDRPADVTLRAPASRLLKMLTSENPRHQLYADDVSIEGNIGAMQDLQQLLLDLDIDWENQLANLVGDIPAQTAGQLLKRWSSWKSRACRTQFQNLREYLLYESNLFPSPPEREYFTERLELLRQKTDRLAARLERLKIKLASEGKAS